MVAPAVMNAQTVQWAHKGISPGYEWGNAITTDEQGNVYVSGQIEYTTHFDGGVSLDSKGSHDIFFGKYAPDGTLQWMKSAGGHRGDVSYGVGVDANHNVYSTGEIEDTAYFTPNDSVVCAGSNDMYVTKYDANGNFTWVRSWGSPGNDKGFAMTVTPNGDSYITGYFSAAIDFGSVHLSNSGSGDVYVLKLDANGNVQWAKKGGGAGTDHGHGITYDRFGNIYVVGYFTDHATFSGNTITTGTGVKSAFIARYNSSGNLDWIRSNCCDSSDYDAVAVDEYGNIYAAGIFYNSATLGSTNLTSSGDADILIVKYDPSGNILWAKKAGGPYDDEGLGITVDTLNDIVYVTGQLDDHGYFDSRYAGAAGNRDVFIAGYDLNGNGLWVKPYGGVQRDIGFGISCDRNGYVVTSGVFEDSANFGSYHLTGDLLYDFYVEKVSPAPVNPPSQNASNLVATAANCNDITLTFNSGNGSGRIVIAHPGALVSQTPASGTIYNANSTYGQGTDLGNNNWVVYAGSGNSVTVTGLAPSTTYYFAVYEYIGNGAFISYQLVGPAQNSLTSGGTVTFNLQSSSNSFCVGTTVTLTASGGNNYQWSPSNGLSSTTGSSVQANPQTSQIYTVTADVGGCLTSNTVSLTVNPLPNVSYSNPVDSVCINAANVTLTGGTPSGGSYSGSGVAAGVFHPAVAGVGLHQIMYSYTDGNGCTNTDPSSIKVLAKPTVNIGNDTILCPGASIQLWTGAGFTSYVWMTGWTHSHITIDSSGVGIGTKPVWVTVYNSSGCSNNDTINITFTVCAGIDEAGNNPMIGIYPNPFNNVLNMHLDQISDLYIYDATGKLVSELAHQTGDITLGSDLQSGIYLITVYQKTGRSLYRIVKE
jgi:hypothetical protein